MSDLIDYLRDKLDHADDVVCSCPDCDVSSYPGDPTATVKGWSAGCMIHGLDGTYVHALDDIKPIGREARVKIDPIMGFVPPRVARIGGLLPRYLVLVANRATGFGYCAVVWGERRANRVADELVEQIRRDAGK